ncbi:MAG: DUF5801 repeats-in-toxin domain-containing protein [Erythrobacter sp.]|nr:DUF5801 repeats-in-toxin domain-containing protein [Erythrobacter sp.]
MGAVEDGSVMDFEDQSDSFDGQETGGVDSAGASETVLPAGNEVVTLPPGLSLEGLEVNGRDLVILLSDGSRIVVPDGAVFVPQIIVDGVAVPPLNIAQLLTGNDPEPAAGASQSSGGNFADDEGAIQDAFDLGDLLPFTTFGFPEDTEEEIIPFSDEEPEVVIQTPNDPVGSQDAVASVDEAGLPERGDGEQGEPEGTDEPSNSETTTGTIVFDAPDGLESITINGQPVTSVGQTVSTPLGTLTITSINLATGEIGFSYTLEDNTLGEESDVFDVVVEDVDGDQATAALTIDIVDDAPIAADDVGVVPAGSHDPITGDVLVNDVPGADGYATDGAVLEFGNESGTVEPGSSLQGEYGVLTLNPDGTYTYVRDVNTPGGVEDTFTYTIVDQDGSTSSATLVIEIGDAPDQITGVPRTGEGTVVEEGGLPTRGDEPAGTGEIADNDAGNNSDPSETTGSTITFNSPDGLASVTLGGVEIDPENLPQIVLDNGTGTLVVTGFTYDPVTGDGSIDYEFTLDDNTSGDDTSFDFEITVIDLDGDVATDTLTINVVDDEPEAEDDSGSQSQEDAPITVDVFDNDTPGADDVALGTITVVEGSLTGDGTLVNNGDGTFTYTPAPGEEGDGGEEGEGGTISFDYTITDGDGDVSTATVTIDLLPDSTPEIGINELGAAGEDTVDEAGLPARGSEPAGSDEASDSETSSGIIAIETGNDTVGSLVINGVDVTNGGTVTTGKGELVVTLSGGTYSYTYTLTDNTLSDPDTDDFTLELADSDGDTASTTLTINIQDDVPQARDDTAAQSEEDAPVTVDVFANDTPGADGVDLSSIEVVPGSLNGAGTLVNNGDGTFTYTPAPGEEGTDGGEQGLGPVTFDYTITDGDGDVSTATVTITLLPDSTPEIGINELGAEGEDLVDEAGLPARGAEPAGSDEASDSETSSGIIAIETGNDTVGSLVINGVDVTNGGTITTANGELVVTLSGGVYSYTYTLTDNTLNDPDSDDFSLTVTDSDGDTASTTLVVVIADDTPSAQDDSNAIGAGEFGPVGGNVLGNDTEGADGADVTSFSGTGGTGNPGDTISGDFGTLTIAADGTYSYTRNPGTPGGVSDTFTYTITDGDGDTATANLIITIADAPTTLDLPVAGEAGTQVEEDGLAGPPAGSDAASDSEFTTGTFTFAAPDGPAVVTIDGVAVTSVGQTFTGAFGTLTIDAIADGSITYTYELTAATNGDNTSDGFVVRVTDQDGDFSEDTLEIAIVDDVPTANADVDSVTEDGPTAASGNLLTGVDIAVPDANATDGVADVTGADGATVTGVAAGDTGSDVNGNVGGNVVGTYGEIGVLANGDYLYILDNQNPAVQGLDSTETLTEVFTYTITDGDGDTSTTTLTITINGQDDPVVINGLDLDGPEVLVDEDDLPDGSSPDAGGLTQSGTFTVTSADGLVSLTVGGVEVFAGSITYPVTIDDPTYGLLTITGVTPATDGDGDVVSATVAYTYVLEDNSLLHTVGNDGSFTDSFAVVATDTDGSTDTDSLDVVVIDDTPSANPDSDSVTEDGPLTADGNVLTGTGGSDANATDGVADVAGADGATVTAVAFGMTDGTVGTALAGAYGTLTLNADGSYSYELDNSNPLVQGLDSQETLTEVFDYTITDGDGDTASTTLTITINGADDGVTINGLDLDPAELTVDEDDLADGSSPDAGELTQTGSFTITGPDGLASITAGGQTVWTDTGGFVAGQTVTTAIGTFEITGVTPTTTDANGDVTEATVTFSYTLDDNTLTHSSAGEDTILESFAISATDTDGSSDNASVDVLVIDDIPDVSLADANAPTLVTDDSDIGGRVGATDTDNFAGLFSTVFGADGPAAADATVYSLSINGGDGTDSGLNDTLTGEDILLRLNGDTIEGYLATSGDLAFTLELNPATGDITQTQLRAIEHDDPIDPDETEASGAAETLNAGLLSLTATVTDGDGDVDSETIDISGSFAFEDDGPGFNSIVVGIPLDEDDLVPAGNGDTAAGDDFSTSLRTFTYDVDFGADGANADEITASFIGADGTDPGTGPLTLSSGGDPVIFDWDPATNTLTGYTTDINDPVLTMVFDLGAGTMTLEYLKPLDHPSTDADGANDGPETGYEDNIELNFEVVITDGDGDTATFPLSLNIDDDLAIALADSEIQLTENEAFTIDALDNDAFGADGVDTTDAGKVFVSTQATQGTVTYDPGTGLFTYTPDPGAGSLQNTSDFFEYTIIDGDGDASTARVDVTLQPDSEPSPNEDVATVDDDGLVGGNPLSTTGDLDANIGDDPGDTSEASYTGIVPVDVGNDGPATVSFVPGLNGSTAAIGQETVTYSVTGNLLTATVTGGTRDGTDLFTVEITDTETGAYVVTLLDNVLHDAGSDENDAFASIDLLVTDSEGDTTISNLGIVFDDDGPTATDNSASVTEGGIVGGNVLTDDDGAGTDAAGADDYAPTGAINRIDSVNEGTNQTTVDGSGNLILAGEFGTLTINVDTGVYSYSSDANATNVDAQEVFTYTIVDGDGDEATATLTIDIDDVSADVSDNDAIVNEAGLPIGSDPTSDSETFDTGQITVVGAAGTLVYNLLSPATGTYGTLVLNPTTGEYTYTLVTPFSDTIDENGPNVVNGAESFDYEVRDTLGNLLGTGTIDVSIVDDVPTATDQANIDVAEDAVGTIGGNVVTDGTPDTPGADGATVTAITIDGNETAVPQDGNDAVVVTANGTYTIDMDGNWTFDPSPNLDHTNGDIDATFTYTLTDGDGDFDTAVQPITITDGEGPTAGPPISLALDDSNLADGSNPAGPDSSSDTITFTPGSDDIASIVFGDVSGLGGGLDWVRVSDTQITGSDGGRLVVTLDLSVLNNVATVTATLNDNYDDHPLVNSPDVVDLGDVDVVATDIDGDTASATVSISVDDDEPTVTASAPDTGALTVDETDFTTDATADFSGLFTPDFNADNPGTLGGYTLAINPGTTGLVDTATGEAVVLVLNAGVVEGRTDTTGELVFIVSVDTAGVVELDQLRAVEHPVTTDPNDPIGFAADDLITLSATVTDSDGDTDTATVGIAGGMTFLDDGPSISNADLGSSVDVDETDGLPTSDTSAASIVSFIPDFGADDDGGTAFTLTVADPNSGLATADGDFPITLVQTSPTVITGQFNDGGGVQDAFTVTINPDGTVTLTQLVALEHLIDGDDSAGEHDDTLSLGGKIDATVTITDGDGDTANATVAIGAGLTFFDDGPSVTLSGSNPDLQVSDADLATDASLSFAGAFTFDGGTDGTQSTDYALSVTDGTASGLFDTATGNEVFLFLESGVVVGREGGPTGQIVFTVTVASDGTVELDQLRAVDHSLSTLDGANATLLADNLVQLTATITDNDGDTDSATLDIGSDLLFADDTPTAAVTETAFLDDDTQTDGNPGGPDDQDPDEANLTGTLVDPVEGFGNDGGTVAFATTGAPAGFQYVASGSDILIQQDQGSGFITVVTVTLDPNTGAYTVTQNANILHTDDGNNDENEQTFTLSATLTDGDGDTDTTSLTIVVDDDTPIAVDGNSAGVVDEDGLTGGIDGGTGDVPGTDTVATGSVSSFFSAGADAPLTYSLSTDTSGLGAFTSGGVAVTYSVSGNTLTASAGTTPVFTLVLDSSTGDWTFTLLAPLDHAAGGDENDLFFDFAGLIIATDADGDEVLATAAVASVRINDDTPVAVNDTNALGEDTASVGGNILTDPTADGFGADGAGDPAITAISGSGGAGTVGGSTTGTWGTLDLAADGTYTYNLDTALVQGLDDGETETDTFTYAIVDADGDTSTATLTITINGANDAPVANADTNWTIEDAAAPITGNVLQTIAHNGAPDGNPRGDVADIDVDVEPLTVTTVGTFVGTYGTLTLNSDGSYSYALDNNNPAVQALSPGDAPLTDSFNYTATDGDLTDSSTLTISIFGENDAPVVGTATVATSDEGLPGGLPDTNGTPTDTTDLATASGNITITDADDTTFTVTLSVPTETLSSGGETITWSLSPDGKTLTGSTVSAGTVLTVVIDDTGAFTVTQSARIDHADTTTEDVTGFTVDVSVNDGTTTTTQTDAITVSLEDDSPVITAPISDEQVLNDPDEAPLVGDLNFAPGGDGPGTDMMIMADVTGLTAGGQPLATSQTGNVLTAYVDNDNSGTLNAGDLEVFTITVDPSAGTSGTYTFDLLVPLDPEITAVDIGTDGAFGVGPSQSVIVSQSSTGDDLVFVTGWEPDGNGGLFTGGELTDWLGGGNPDLNQRADVNGSTAGFGLGNNNLNAGEFMRFDFGPLDDYDGAGPYTPPGGTALLNAAFVTFSVSNFGSGDVVHFVAHYTDGTTEDFTLTGSGGNSTASLTITAPAGKTLSFVDVYQESGQVKLNLDEVGTIETTIDVDIPVSIKLTDGDGDPVMDDFVISIFDDAPDAIDDLTVTTVGGQDVNAAFVLDFSGSINNSELNLQLNAVKDAAFELFETTTGSVDITLITFSGTAQLEGTFSDFAAFAAAIDDLNNQLGGTRSFSGSTDFTDAILEVIAEYTPSTTASNQVFFLSDGNPNQQTGSGGNSLLDSVATQWQTFIDDNDVNVTAIGVGGGINTARLQDVDLDGEGAPILAADFEALIDTLISAVTPPIGGNVLTNDIAATNGIEVVSIVVDGISYVFDGVNTITPSSGSPITGTSFTATTGFGGELTFDFSDGSFTYEPPAVSVPEIENFQYTVVDGDGDTDTAILRIDIAAVSEPTNFAKNDVVITNAGTSVAIDEDWLLQNDTAGTSIDSVGNADSGSVSRSSGTTTFVDSGADTGGSFTYAASNGSNTDNAFVTVNREQAGESSLDGTSGDDILIGRDGANDDIDGGDGADIMFGGTGSDDFNIDDGDSNAVVSGSGDNGTVSGFDTIVDFNSSVDDIDFNGTAVVGSTTSGTDGTDSTLTIGGQTVKSHAVSNGIITFDDQNSFSSALTLSTEGDVAAVVDYLQNNDIGASNSVVAFVVGSDSYLYFQDNSSPTLSQDNLVKLEGVTLTNVSSLIGSAIFPVVLDLDGDGAEFVGISAGVTYDYDGDGTAEATAWVGADDAILAYDANGDGTVTDASEFVFGGEGFTDLDAIAARYDDNADGVLDASDSAYADFGIWQDANQNGVADAGEFISLEDAGIISIGLVSDEVDAEAAGGDVGIFGSATFTFADGTTGIVADTAFATGSANDNDQNRAALRTTEVATVAALASSLLMDTGFAFGMHDNAARHMIEDPIHDGIAVQEAAFEMRGEAFQHVEISSDLLSQASVDLGSVDFASILDSHHGMAEPAAIQAITQPQSNVFETIEWTSGFEASSASPAPSPFAGMDVSQAMEALLILDGSALEAVAAIDPVDAVLAELAAENLLDQVIDRFDDQSQTSDYLMADAAGAAEGLLDQIVEAGINTTDALHAVDQQLDEAAAAAAQA